MNNLDFEKFEDTFRKVRELARYAYDFDPRTIGDFDRFEMGGGGNIIIRGHKFFSTKPSITCWTILPFEILIQGNEEIEKYLLEETKKEQDKKDNLGWLYRIASSRMGYRKKHKS